jgi:hypothetical protein
VNEHTLNQWKENLDEPLPGLDPEAQVVRRTIAFAHHPETPWMAVHDYVKTTGPASFDYLLHALERIQLDQQNQRLLVKNGEVEMDVYFLAPQTLEFRQTDEFPIAPEERYEGAPDQWHFTASTIENASEMRYLVLMIPRPPETDERPVVEVKELDYGSVKGFQVGDEKIMAWWGTGEEGDFSSAGTNERAKLVVEYSEHANKKKRIVQ